jgi:hypothetical protein
MSDASMSKEDMYHVFRQLPTLKLEEFTKRAVVQAQARKQRDALKDKLADIIGLCGIHDVVRMLAEFADDKAYETQDHEDDLICMVLAKTEKQIWGLTLSQQHKKQNGVDNGQMELSLDRNNEQNATR